MLNLHPVRCPPGLLDGETPRNLALGGWVDWSLLSEPFRSNWRTQFALEMAMGQNPEPQTRVGHSQMSTE